MRKQIRVVIALLALTVGSIGAASAITYDISNDFSTAPQPSGVWTYGYSTTLGGSLILYDLPSTNGVIQVWQSSIVQSFGAPADFNNPSGAPVSTCGSCDPLPAHTAGFHPGPNGEFSLYRFTAPGAGTYQLDAVFGGIDSGGTNVYVLDKGSTIYSNNVTRGSSVSFSESLALGLNDQIDFAVGPHNGSFFSDSTSIDASLTVTAVPEPEIYAMLAAGLGLMSFVARRRRGQAAAA